MNEKICTKLLGYDFREKLTCFQKLFSKSKKNLFNSFTQVSIPTYTLKRAKKVQKSENTLSILIPF